MKTSFAQIQEKARTLLAQEWKNVDKRSDIDVPKELLPLFERLVVPGAHPHTLLAIATADTVITDQSQRQMGKTIVRFIIIDSNTMLDVTPLPGTTMELDVIIIKKGVDATLTLLNEADALVRHEILIEENASLTLAVGHIGASGTYTRQSTLLGEGARLSDAEFVIGDNLVLDNTVVHAAAHTTCAVTQYGIALDASSTRATGLLHVLPRSQQSDTSLRSKWVLLSPTAVATVIPSLEVEADDVQASHSASITPLDPEHLFYLQSRGITDNDARALILEGFVAPVLDVWPKKTQDAIKAKVRSALEVTHG